jgi:hypothetical protein
LVGWRCCWGAPSLPQLPPATSKNPPPYISLLFLCFCSVGVTSTKSGRLEVNPWLHLVGVAFRFANLLPVQHLLDLIVIHENCVTGFDIALLAKKSRVVIFTVPQSHQVAKEK